MTSLARLAVLRICACQVLFEPGLNRLRVQSNYSDAGIFRPQLGERNCDVVVTVLRSGAFPRLFLPIDGCSQRNDRFDPATLAANVRGHGAVTNRKARGNPHLISRFERGLCVRLVWSSVSLITCSFSNYTTRGHHRRIGCDACAARVVACTLSILLE
jgi:hypothetical protein